MMRKAAFVSMACVLLACGGEITSTDGGGGDSGTASDADSGTCVVITASQFDTSCQGTPDCIAIGQGNICSGYNCLCPTGTINASGEAQYQAELAKVTSGGNACGCPFLGTPQCISSQCVFCPNPALNGVLPPGCPDGG